MDRSKELRREIFERIRFKRAGHPELTAIDEPALKDLVLKAIHGAGFVRVKNIRLAGPLLQLPNWRLLGWSGDSDKRIPFLNEITQLQKEYYLRPPTRH